MADFKFSDYIVHTIEPFLLFGMNLLTWLVDWERSEKSATILQRQDEESQRSADLQFWTSWFKPSWYTTPPNIVPMVPWIYFLQLPPKLHASCIVPFGSLSPFFQGLESVFSLAGCKAKFTCKWIWKCTFKLSSLCGTKKQVRKLVGVGGPIYSICDNCEVCWNHNDLTILYNSLYVLYM